MTRKNSPNEEYSELRSGNRERLASDHTSSNSNIASPHLISFGNSYIDRYMTENLTIRSTNQRSSVGSSSYQEIIIDPKWDANGRLRIDKDRFREQLVEQGIIKKRTLKA